MRTLEAYLNQFNLQTHAGEVKRLCEAIPVSRNHLYVMRRGGICTLDMALSLMRATNYEVDPRSLETGIDWESLDAYYEKHGGAASPFRGPKSGRAGDSGGKASAKPAGSGSGKGKAVAARSPARR